MNVTVLRTSSRCNLMKSLMCLVGIATFAMPATTRANDDSLAKQIAELQSELDALNQKFEGTKAVESDEQMIRQLVKQTFELQTQLQRMRITKAQADLKKVQEQFAARIRASDSIIESRVNELTKKLAANEDSTDDASAKVLSAEGWQAWRKRDWRTALSKFKSSIEKDDSDANTLNGLGWTYLHLGEHKKSLAAFEKGRDLAPEHGGILNGIGQNYRALGQYDKATEILVDTIARINEQLGEATAVRQGATAPWFALADLYLTTKQPDEAIKLAERYLKHKADANSTRRMEEILKHALSMKEELSDRSE